MSDKKETDGTPADQLPVPKSGKLRKKLSLEQATEAIVLHDKSLGRIAVPTTPSGNRNYQLYMVSVMREAGKNLLKIAKMNDYAGFTMQQFKQYAEAMKIIGDMAYEAFRNPEDPNNEIPAETSPLTGIMGKLLDNVKTVSNPASKPDQIEDSLGEIELVCEELEEELEHAIKVEEENNE